MRPSRSWDSELLCYVITDNNYTILDTMRNFVAISKKKEAVLLVVNVACGCYGQGVG